MSVSSASAAARSDMAVARKLRAARSGHLRLRLHSIPRRRRRVGIPRIRGVLRAGGVTAARSRHRIDPPAGGHPLPPFQLGHGQLRLYAIGLLTQLVHGRFSLGRRGRHCRTALQPELQSELGANHRLVRRRPSDREEAVQRQPGCRGQAAGAGLVTPGWCFCPGSARRAPGGRPDSPRRGHAVTARFSLDAKKPGSPETGEPGRPPGSSSPAQRVEPSAGALRTGDSSCVSASAAAGETEAQWAPHLTVTSAEAAVRHGRFAP